MRPRTLGLLLAAALAVLVSAPVVAADRDSDGLRDSFETKWGVTDPDNADTDGDGVVDSAEDDDGDRLSNLGEQRFGTNPAKRDSDKDGKSDGAEDADRDGLSNAQEQDRRPLPKRLRPSLGKAPVDYPEARADCFGGLGDSVVKRCRLGERGSETTIAIFGDSHALQWVPALRRAAKQEGWELVTLLKGGCPSTRVLTTSQEKIDGNRSCSEWRRKASAWLREHPPAVVILANSDGYGMVDRSGRPIKATSQRLKTWKKGLTDALRALPRSSQAVVLGEAPDNRGDPIACLRSNSRNISACAARPVPPKKRIFEVAERQAAKAAGAQFRSLYGKVCTYDPCPLVQGDVLVWRDHAHLTATFVKQLTPAMRALLVDVLPKSQAEPASLVSLGPPAPPTLGEWLTGVLLG